MPGATEIQRRNNLRTGLVLGGVALSFFLAVVAKYYWLNG
jgi:hypothetical protein